MSTTQPTHQSVPGAGADSENHGLHRGLTSGQMAMIGLSGAMGTGLFLGSGSVIALAGPATAISYALAGLLALAVVWALAEMVTIHPVPGGHGAIAASYLGSFGGYVARWTFAIQSLVAISAEVTASATYLQFWFPRLPLWVGALGCSIFIGALNLFSVRLYGSTEYWFSMIKVITVVGFIILGLALVVGAVPGVPAVGLHNLTAHGGFFPKGLTGVLAAACMATFSFGGVENSSVGAAESENPERDVPRAAGTMFWRLLIFYVLAILVVLMLQPWTKTAASNGTVGESPFVIALRFSGVPGAAHIMNVVLLVAALSAVNGFLYGASRMFHSLAVDGEAPAFAKRVAPNGSPRGAVYFAVAGMVATSILALVSPANAFAWIVGIAIFGILVIWATVMLTPLSFRRQRARVGAKLPPRRLWFSPYSDYLVLACLVGVLVAMFWLEPVVWYAGVPYLLILMASYFVLRHFRTLPEPEDLLAEEIGEQRAAE